MGSEQVDRPLCGSLDCLRCAALTRRLLRLPARRAILPGPAPTAAALERHAKRFGPEQVAETAAEYGLSVAIQRPKRIKRQRGGSMTDRVVTYLRAGHGVDVVAELEDLTPARAKAVVAKAQARLAKENA